MMDESRKRGVIELLANEDFKRWVLEPTYERNLFWRKWMENNPDKEQQVKIAREVIRAAGFPKPIIKPEDKDEVLSRIIAKSQYMEERSDFGAEPQQRRSAFGQYFFKAAAVLLLIFMFGGLVWKNFQEKNEAKVPVEEITFIKKGNPAGRKSVIKLPDGTKVYLNSGSTLTYSSAYGQKDRTVEISGEAFFEVKSDASRPFNVKSGKIVTTALGTSFNVRAFEKEGSYKVSLRSGKVKVANVQENAADQQHILLPGEGFIIPKQMGEFEKVTIDPVRDFGWKDGILAFEGNSLEEVIQILERWYGVQIKVTGTPKNEWRVFGKFNNEPLEQVLKGLSFTYSMDFRISGKDVELKF